MVTIGYGRSATADSQKAQGLGGTALHSQAAQYTAGQRASAHMRPRCGALQITNSSPVPQSMLLYRLWKVTGFLSTALSRPASAS